MNRKLNFTLSKKRQLGLMVLTHRGSSFSIYPGDSKTQTFLNEEMNGSQLESWYNSRYKSLGLDTLSLDKDKDLVDVQEGFSEERDKENLVEGGTHIESLASAEEASAEEASAEEASAEEADVVYFRTTPEEEWDYGKLTEFVQLHKLQVSGRKKKDYAEAVKLFLSL